jgi:hypothetical protein
MRLWSLHPKYLDRMGLLACWRESLLAQAVLLGGAKGYQQHPQLARFKDCTEPLPAIATYLASIANEADSRGYHFNRSKIPGFRLPWKLPISNGQILYEWEHLKGKLVHRDPERLKHLNGINMPESHPLFVIVPGEVETWEKVPSG